MSYLQKGGSLPYRFYRPNATPFQPCQSCNGKKVNAAPPQQGGSHVMPYRFYNPKSTAFKPCGCGKNKVKRMESGNTRDFKGNVYYNDFPAYPVYNDASMDYSGTGCTGMPNCGCKNCRDLTSVVNSSDKVAQVKFYQTGGNPVGAPFEIFSDGNKPLKYNYNLEDNFGGLPVFHKVQASRHASNPSKSSK